jgi:hypothetical protein
MCDCAVKVKEALDKAIKSRNDAFAAYHQWEGAVSAMEQLIPVLFPLNPEPVVSRYEDG